MPVKLFKSFETERLLLRPTGIQDEAFIFRLLNMPKWIQFIGDRQVDSVEKAKSYIQERMLPQLERLGFGNYTVIRKSDSKKLGSCGLYDREGLEGIDIGFAFLPAYEGKGYAYEAASRLMRAAREDFGLNGLCAITNKDNIASQRLLQRLGLQEEGLIRLEKDSEDVLLFLLR